MLVGIQDEILRLNAKGLLAPLLADKTTKRNILWATDAYRTRGFPYERTQEILPMLITGTNADVIKTRARKEMEQQSERTRRHAEVFTPLYICRRMIAEADALYFGGHDPFMKDGVPAARKDFQDPPDSFYTFKVFIPKANGSGALGEVLSTPLIGATETFLSIGAFATEREAANCLKYVKGKFARAMLGVLKVTQDLSADKWKCVPLQDFSSSSDIDWSQSIAEIDQQLYAKYGLSAEEIAFIESHVKEMT